MLPIIILWRYASGGRQQTVKIIPVKICGREGLEEGEHFVVISCNPYVLDERCCLISFEAERLPGARNGRSKVEQLLNNPVVVRL